MFEKQSLSSGNFSSLMYFLVDVEPLKDVSYYLANGPFWSMEEKYCNIATFQIKRKLCCV